MITFLRTEFNYSMDEASDASALDCRFSAPDPYTGEIVETPSMAQQSFADECDINTIVKRFGLTGEMPTGLVAPTYQDFADVFDFQSAMNAIATAREAFDELPAQVRARFQNDPQQFVAFCSDEANRAEAEKMGLIVPRMAAGAASLVGTTSPTGEGPQAPGGPPSGPGAAPPLAGGADGGQAKS